MEFLYYTLKELPDWQQFIIAVVATLAAAYIVQVVVISTLRALTRRTKTSFDDKMIGALQRPLFHSVVYSGAALIIIVASFPPTVETMVITILKTVLLLLWAHFALVAGRITIRTAAASEHHLIKPATAPLFENLFVMAVVVLAIYVAFSLWGINMTAWLASAGIIGIAVGFAAKDTLANLFSGIFILADAPYKIGDYIVLDTGERGKVVHLGIRSTRIITRGDVEVTIPNAVMSGAKIVNESGGPTDQYRVKATVGVAYDSDLDLVEKILIDIAQQEPELVAHPVPRVRFRLLGPSSLEYDLFGWIENPEHRSKAIHNLNRAIILRFREENIHIPFPQQDVHITKQ